MSIAEQVAHANSASEKAVHWQVGSLHEYHADRTADSSSSLGLFRENPYAYYRQRVLGEAVESSRSQAKELGTAVHLAFYEPHDWERRIIVLPEGTGWRTKAAETTRACASPECVVLTQEDREKCDAMVAAIRANPVVADLMSEGGRAEHAVRFRWPGFQAPLKVCFDFLTNSGAILDLKTSNDPSPSGFARAANEYGYHRSAALYSMARDLYVGPRRWHGSHHWIVVSNQEPHECVVYQIGERSLELGKQQIERTLTQLDDRRDFAESEEWHREGFHAPLELDVPQWAFNEK